MQCSKRKLVKDAARGKKNEYQKKLMDFISNQKQLDSDFADALNDLIK